MKICKDLSCIINRLPGTLEVLTRQRTDTRLMEKKTTYFYGSRLVVFCKLFQYMPEDVQYISVQCSHSRTFNLAGAS